MKCIFITPGQPFVEVGEQQVTLLSEVEFNVLQAFVQQLEDGSTRVEDF
jgi:hypothetical protein